MYAIKKPAHKLINFLAVVLVLCLVFNPVVVLARSASEIEAEKAAKQKELDALNSNLKKAEQTLQTNVARRSSSLSEIEKTKAEIAEIESQLEVNKLKKEQLEQEISIKTLEKEERERQQNIQIATSYISWKTQDETVIVFGGQDVLKNAIYYDYVTETSKDSILGLVSELNQLTKSNDEYQKQIEQLSQDNTALADRKANLEKQIVQFNANIASARTNVGVIKQKINLVSAEQQAILQQEKSLLGDSVTIGTLDIQKGQFYFSGSGRDLTQGHGVGMSQYGAKGYASAGWSAEQILKLYYTGVEVVDYPMSEHVWVVYCPSAPTTDDPPCNNGEAPITKKVSFDDYLGGLGEMPENWPVEARKAQLIGARTYAVHYTNNGSADRPICLTQSCQVNYLKTGGTDNDFFHDGDLDVTLQTKDKVIRHNGNLITAVYSSDNSQGYGTANNDTIWSGVDGSGTPYPYLRHVNDTQHAEKTQWTNWQWRTNGYTVAQFNDLLNHAADPSKSNTHAKAVKAAVGEVTGLGFVKDPSGRVKIVVVKGTNGEKNMAGWYFKAIWNSWINSVKPSGQLDYIYSLTWNFQQQQ